MSGKIDCLTEFVAYSNRICIKELEHEHSNDSYHSFYEGRLSLGKEIMYLLSNNVKEREEWIRNYVMKHGG